MSFQTTLINEAADDADKALARKRAEQEAARHDAEGAAGVVPIDPPLPEEETRLEHAAAEGGDAQASAEEVDAKTKADYRP
ncbi:hypothetical protein [Uliginosibacterium sp. H1]|uniref:hypothetical protein n=1 Tax=Uliginosibacterium sp. H1 TaxID=3114757 RepID=UPI002809D8F4|nr:hypothetical protein [Moraxellaceae bacterium]MEC5399105.1 hypothetical protein [Uliginosibacterium sp. H1]